MCGVVVLLVVVVGVVVMRVVVAELHCCSVLWCFAKMLLDVVLLVSVWWFVVITADNPRTYGDREGNCGVPYWGAPMSRD